MPHDNAIGIATGLVLLASVLAMIVSMNALARAVRVPDGEAEIAATASPKFLLTERRSASAP